MKFTIIAVSVPALRPCTSENVPDAADGTDDGKYSALCDIRAGGAGY